MELCPNPRKLSGGGIHQRHERGRGDGGRFILGKRYSKHGNGEKKGKLDETLPGMAKLSNLAKKAT